LAATACGPAHVRVPDTRPPLLPPPEAALRPCPTAEREGTGAGYAPDIERGTTGEILRAFQTTVRYGRTCAARHRTLIEHWQDALQRQREATQKKD